MNAWITSVALVAAMVLPVPLWAQDLPDPVSGKRLYRAYCLACHGLNGSQPGPLADKLRLHPADLTTAKYHTRSAADLAALAAGYGPSVGLGMPMWGSVLPDDELLDIAAYLRVLAKSELRYRGDTRRGRAVFRGMCIACHGRFGTGNGLLANVIGVPMVDFTSSLSLSALSSEELVATIRDGRGEFMPPWRDLLAESEILDVASYVQALPEMALAVEPADEKAADPVAGGRLYQAYCLVCHGRAGNTVGPVARKQGYTPSDLTSPAFARRTIEELAAIIGGYSRSDTSNMPRWGAVLSRKDLRDIAAYISDIRSPEAKITGDAHRGRAVFKATCIACHGSNGSGDGILARLIDAPMVDFTDHESMSGLRDTELERAVREGKGSFMPAWKEVLSKREIADVVRYVRALAR